MLIALLSSVLAAPLTWATKEPVTWYFVVETAGGGLGVANAAREPLAQLIEALPAGDRVEIQVIHTRTSTLLERTVDDAGRAALAAEVRALVFPTAKATDMGAALSHLMSRLSAAGGPREVLMVSSFCHQPPIGSPWADGGFGCRSILGLDALNTEVDARGGLEKVEAHLFPVDLPTQVHDPRGVSQASTILAPAFVAVEASPVDAWLATARAGLALHRARPEVRAEATAFAVTATVLQEPTPEAPRARIELTSNLAHLGFGITQLTVEGGRIVTPPTALAPGATFDVDVDVPAPSFSLLPRTDTVELPLTFRIAGALTPEDALREAGIEPSVSPVEVAVVARAARSYGLSPLRAGGMLASVLLLAGAGTLALRRRLAPIRFGGTFTYRKAGGARRSLDIGDRSEAAIVVLPDGSLGLGRKEDAVIVLRMERPLWNTRASVWVRAAAVELNARPAAPGWHKIVAGATSFQFQDFRLSWE